MPGTSKKMSTVNILRILYRHTDKDHRMSREEISEKLKEEFDMTVDLKTIRRNISDLIENGYDIKYREIERKTASDTDSGSSSNMWTDFYLERTEFTEDEIALIFDALLMSECIDDYSFYQIIDKMEDLLHIHIGYRYNTIKNEKSYNLSTRYHALENFKIISRAMNEQRRISFSYKEPDSNENEISALPGLSEDGYKGYERIWPFRIRVKYNTYWLECFGKMFRLDHMQDIKISENTSEFDEATEGLKTVYDLNGNRRYIL